jgi:hypothetical protein
MLVLDLSENHSQESEDQWNGSDCYVCVTSSFAGGADNADKQKETASGR